MSKIRGSWLLFLSAIFFIFTIIAIKEGDAVRTAINMFFTCFYGFLAYLCHI